ncbi:VOC family protein [Phytoactinopolyspora halophila]|uniref:VOC family protein n=1 Tax=Phytoactinopolyspora halophila TaxID=1981511 RepID=UPI001314ADF2|nr:hypothetical protein [Phytoactinopolyspora halophila]
MSGEIVYFELPGNDVEATQRFWGSLFGWAFNEGNFAGYSMIDGPSPMGGTPHGDPSHHPRIFFRVDDISAATTRVRELGGTAEESVNGRTSPQCASCAHTSSHRYPERPGTTSPCSSGLPRSRISTTRDTAMRSKPSAARR